MHDFEVIVEKFLNNKEEDRRKKLDIAVHHVAISYLMPSIIANFKKNNPEVEIIIRNISPSEAVQSLKEGKIDLAFYPNIPNQAEFKKIEVASYDPVLIMNKKHPLAKKNITNLSDLKNFDLIRIDRNLVTLPLFEEAINNHKIKSSIEFENGNWDMLKNFVKENNFIAVISKVCIDKKDSELVVKNLVKFFPKMNYAIHIKCGQLSKPLINNLIKSVKEVSSSWKGSENKSQSEYK
jgi:DNA-binding transcriptional LysR family regulator